MTGRTTCRNCMFSEFGVNDDGPMIECRRFAPQLVVLDGEVTQAWPQMEADDWCGSGVPSAERKPS